jgi:hypothetical protein
MRRKLFLNAISYFQAISPHKRLKKTQPIANYLSQTFEEKHGQKRLLSTYLYPSYTPQKLFL